MRLPLKMLGKELRLGMHKPGNRHKITSSAYWKKLSYTDTAMVHLARALIANPEVLVVHRPARHFDARTGELIMRLLREFVNNRGIEIDRESRHRRRPRTCFFSTDSQWAAEQADLAWLVQSGNVQDVPIDGLDGLDIFDFRRN